MTTENVEPSSDIQLAEIRARHANKKRYSMKWFGPYYRPDVGTLLELVDNLAEDLQDPTRDEWEGHARYLGKEVERLQEQVRQLGEQISAFADLDESVEIQRLQNLVRENDIWLLAATNKVRFLEEQVRDLGSRCTHVDLCPHCGV